MGKPSDKMDMTGMNVNQIAKRSDELRDTILTYLTTVDYATIAQIAQHTNTTVPHIRNHTKLLIQLGCMVKHGHGIGTTYSTTHMPYRPVRKSPAHKLHAEQEAAQQSHVRVVKLLDRRPHEISKEEHEASRRRYLRSAFTSSSMGMFDGF